MIAKRNQGWLVVAACFLCGALSAPGQSYALGLYFESFVSDLGVSPVALASVYAWATLAAALLLPWLGGLADRSSSRTFLVSVVAALGITLVVTSLVGSVFGLAAALFALRLLGQGAIGIGTLSAVVRWFRRHRGRAAAIAASGYAFGEFVAPGVIVWLEQLVGWRASLVVLGLTYLLVLTPVLSLLLRDPDAPSDAPIRVESDPIATKAGWKRPLFWVLVLLATLVPLVLTGVFLNQVGLFRAAGWDTTDVVSTIRAYAVTNLIVTYLTGWLLESTPSKVGLVLAMFALAAALTVPLLGHHSTHASLVYGALLGAAAGATSGTNGVIWADYFGVESIGSVKGFVNAARNGATALGAVIFAAAGARGAYDVASACALILACVALAAAALLPVPNSRSCFAPSEVRNGRAS